MRNDFGAGGNIGKLSLKDRVNLAGAQGDVSPIQDNTTCVRDSAPALGGGSMLWPTLQLVAVQDRKAINGSLYDCDSLRDFLTLQRKLSHLIWSLLHNHCQTVVPRSLWSIQRLVNRLNKLVRGQRHDAQ